MKKAKRYAAGGMTQADIDAGLTQEMFDAGMRGGRNERISDEDRSRALASAGKDNSESIVDKYRDMKKNPDAQAFPVDMGTRSAPRPAPRPAPRAAPRPAPMEMPEESASPTPGLNRSSNEVPSVPAPIERKKPPSRGSYDKPGPFGDLMKLLRGGSGPGSARIKRGLADAETEPYKKGGAVKGKSSSASKRGDGIASRGKTKGRMC